MEILRKQETFIAQRLVLNSGKTIETLEKIHSTTIGFNRKLPSKNDRCTFFIVSTSKIRAHSVVVGGPTKEKSTISNKEKTM